MIRSVGVTIALASVLFLGSSGATVLGAEAIPSRTPAPTGFARVVIDGRVVTVSVQVVWYLFPRPNLHHQAGVWVNLHTADPRGLPRTLTASTAQWRSGAELSHATLRPLSYLLARDAAALPPPGFRDDPNDATYFGRARVPRHRSDASAVVKVRLWNARRALDVRVPVEIMVYR